MCQRVCMYVRVAFTGLTSNAYSPASSGLCVTPLSTTRSIAAERRDHPPHVTTLHTQLFLFLFPFILNRNSVRTTGCCFESDTQAVKAHVPDEIDSLVCNPSPSPGPTRTLATARQCGGLYSESVIYSYFLSSTQGM